MPLTLVVQMGAGFQSEELLFLMLVYLLTEMLGFFFRLFQKEPQLTPLISFTTFFCTLTFLWDTLAESH